MRGGWFGPPVACRVCKVLCFYYFWDCSKSKNSPPIVIGNKNTTALTLYLKWIRLQNYGAPFVEDIFFILWGQILLRFDIFAAIWHIATISAACRQRGRMGKGVVFTTTLIEWSGFNPHPSHVVASLDKTLYDDYLCLVVSNKQQIQWTRIRRNPQEHWIIGNS